LGGRDWEDLGLRPAQTKIYKTPSQPMGEKGVAPPWGSTNRRITVQASPCIKQHPFPKITNEKRAGRMA
jgi:hypothetical protein